MLQGRLWYETDLVDFGAQTVISLLSLDYSEFPCWEYCKKLFRLWEFPSVQFLSLIHRLKGFVFTQYLFNHNTQLFKPITRWPFPL